MKKKYKEFADEFDKLCEKYAMDDFNIEELLVVCEKIAKNYGE